MTTPTAARCPGAARLRSRWTARALAGAFLDLFLAWAFLCVAAVASAAVRAASLLGLPLPLPCTCARPHLPCLLAFLARYPARALRRLHASLRARFPFDGEDPPRQREAEELRRELEKERSASASAAEEAMAMILRLQKDKSALEIEARQHRRLLGLAPPDSQPSSSRSALGVRLGNDSGFSFHTPFLRQELDPVMNGGVDDDCVAVQTPPTEEVPVVESKQELVGSCALSARSLDFDQIGDFHVDAGASTEHQTADKFQEAASVGMDTISQDHSGSENDANIYDVHVVDDKCNSKEAKGLICRSFSDATMQTERFQTRAAADDLLMKSLNAVKAALDKLKLAVGERTESLQLLLEDIANQLQEITDAAEVERQLHSASPKNSKKS